MTCGQSAGNLCITPNGQQSRETTDFQPCLPLYLNGNTGPKFLYFSFLRLLEGQSVRKLTFGGPVFIQGFRECIQECLPLRIVHQQHDRRVLHLLYVVRLTRLIGLVKP